MKKVFIVTASYRESSQIAEYFKDAIRTEVAGLTVYTLKGNIEISLAVLGIAKVSFAIGTQLIADRFRPDVIYSLGFCGAIADNAEILDIVLCIEAFQYDVYTSSPQIDNLDSPEYRRLKCYPGNQEMLERTKKIFKDTKIHMLPMATADNFLADEKVTKQLFEKKGPLVVDQETAAFYQSCYYSDIKGLAIKVITDRCDCTSYQSYFSKEYDAASKLLYIYKKLIEYESQTAY